MKVKDILPVINSGFVICSEKLSNPLLRVPDSASENAIEYLSKEMLDSDVTEITTKSDNWIYIIV